MKGSAGIGYYFSGTDHVTVGSLDFKHITQGTIQIGDLAAIFTILTNDVQEDIVRSAMNLIASGVHVQTGIATTIEKIRFPATVTIADLMIPQNELPKEYTPIDSEHGYSPQSQLLFKHDELFGRDRVMSAESKSYQSLKHDGKPATIYYYEYLKEADASLALGPIRSWIWGEDHASVLHPEIIFAVKTVVVVVSSDEPKRFEGLLLNYWKTKFGTILVNPPAVVDGT